jgi:hypothetical protein
LESRALADPDDPADAAARLEQALERIAIVSSQRLAVPPAAAAEAGTPAPAIDTGAIAARLDSLIERLRATLEPSSEG